MRRFSLGQWFGFVLLTLSVTSQWVASASRPKPFAIEVVDGQTGRGVPLVELKTVSNVRYYTDSNGLAAIDDPALVGQTVYFGIRSHGYEIEPDGFGMHGRRFEVTEGGSARVAIKRLNVAERLYRVTGEGIYRDSVVLGRDVPIQKPLLNAQVTGQDSTQRALYNGRIYWFWGDTNRQSYPLGHFWTAGATSRLPQDGGLEPSKGVDLEYFTGDDGFSRPMFPREGNTPIWMDGLLIVKDNQGRQRMLCRASVMKSLSRVLERRLCAFNDETKTFETLKTIPLDAPLAPEGHVMTVEENGTTCLYGGSDFPNVRVVADWDAVQDLSKYEAFTCVAPGGRFKRAETPLERDANGRLVWGWKRDTARLGLKELKELVDAKKLAVDEAWPLPTDVETKQPVGLSFASVEFNPYRKKWVAIALQVGGKSSYLGEVWYSEAEKPEGPWPWVRKIVTHDRYSFYNPVQHPFFAQDGGRLIYFEGTYATTFSRSDDQATPRYDYNQVMYRLDLSDPRLTLPTEPPPRPTSLPRVGG